MGMTKLKDGWTMLNFEDINNKTLLHFSVQMFLPIPARICFEQLGLAISDTEKTWLWPIEYEYSPVRPPKGLVEGGTFQMTYMVPRWDKPEVPPGVATYEYDLKRWNPDGMKYEYVTRDHPMKGGGVVAITPVEDNKCHFSWIGTYNVPGRNKKVGDSLFQYVPVFFGALEDRAIKGQA